MSYINRAGVTEMPNPTNDPISEIVDAAYSHELSWIHDQLDGTSMLTQAIGGLNERKDKSYQAISNLLIDELETLKKTFYADYSRRLVIGATNGKAIDRINKRISALQQQLTTNKSKEK